MTDTKMTDTTMIGLKRLKGRVEGRHGNILPMRRHKSWNADALEESLRADGLLNPLVVVRSGHGFAVVDGHKRLCALKRLAKAERSTRRAVVPCLVREEGVWTAPAPRRPALLSGPELAHLVLVQTRSGACPDAVARRYACERDAVEDCRLLARLHPRILQHFNTGAVTLEQAAALATIPDPRAQLAVLHQLGPFVSDAAMMRAIRNGATVVDVGGDTLVLPSRERAGKRDRAAALAA